MSVRKAPTPRSEAKGRLSRVGRVPLYPWSAIDLFERLLSLARQPCWRVVAYGCYFAIIVFKFFLALVNAMHHLTQEIQVVEAMRQEGGFATLRRLNEIVDFSTWKTKTPEATIRRIVQESSHFFRIQPGLWSLNESREIVLQSFEVVPGNTQSEEQFSHGYYQGLLVEIGKFHNQKTYIPAQDKNRHFIHHRLADITDTTTLPSFTYEKLLRRARTIDVIWFNERGMPSAFYEVEHTTDIKNSLSKFYELQDFYAKFFIVADIHRKREFEDKLDESIFSTISERINFLDYARVARMYEGIRNVRQSEWRP